MALPFKFGIIPKRWASTVQILLEKDPGSPWSHRLRIIELFDAQLNCGLQIIFGKRMINNALKRGLVHKSAYGSVPKRTAQDAVMEKVLSYDSFRTRKTYVKTKYGTSREFYAGSDKEPLYGIGQGNGSGPAFWLSNLIVMFDVLDNDESSPGIACGLLPGHGTTARLLRYSAFEHGVHT